MSEGGAKTPESAPPKDPLIGRVINDRFRILGMVARGGMGKVYRAEQAPLAREVALKILTPTYRGDGDPEFHKRFFLEASTCSKLTHPNTVTIFDYGRTDDEIYYIAMELLEGRTLHRALKDDGPMSAERAMHIARQVCRSLREAHLLGVIHRDLKPANIYLTRHGDEADFVKVLDFGLVKELEGTGEDLTQTGLFMGSPKYMSPEQIKGEDVDARADVYALGVILYEMLTGTVPFDRPNSVNILMAHVHEAPPAMTVTNPEIEVTDNLTAIVMCALQKEPANRFQGMEEMLMALKGLATESGLAITNSMAMLIPQLAPTGSGLVVASTGSTTLDLPALDGRLVSTELEVSAPGRLPSMAGAQPNDTQEGSRAPFVMAGIGLCALIAAAGLALALGGGPETVAEAEPASTPATEDTTAPDETLDVPHTTIRLNSEPPGAMVRVGEERFGPTPTEIEWEGEQAERGRRVEFVFSLAGHQDYPVDRVVTGETLSVRANLAPIAPAPRPTGRRRAGRRTGQSGSARGYKLDPY